ncbi:hypothetical protein [Deinococcus indicus]|uniref:hypothetical protein n=1 Tax=Deinococcus indicus TaxID=223556 RepID=UPI0011786F85|nr:hypothetical protein [Deinococcus indicus]
MNDALSPSLPYPAALLDAACPDVAVSPALVRDLLLYLRATAHHSVCLGATITADHLSSLADQLEQDVLASAAPMKPMTDTELLEEAGLRG